MEIFENIHEALKFIDSLWVQFPDIVENSTWGDSISTHDGISNQVTAALDSNANCWLIYYLDPTNIHDLAKIPMPSSMLVKL